MVGMRSVLYRPAVISVGIAGMALMIALLVLVMTSWRALDMVQPVTNHLHHIQEMQDAVLRAQKLLTRPQSSMQASSQAEVDDIREKLDELIKLALHLDSDTPARLISAAGALHDFRSTPSTALIAALAEIRAALEREMAAQAQLITEMHDYAVRELWIAGALLIGLPVLALVLWLLVRTRIIGSLDSVSRLLDSLVKHDYACAAIDSSDSDLKPVLESYNGLVGRLAETEAENASRRQELETQVRAATHTVLQQSRTLANADRLAAVGETSACIAHELRNPLAGIEMALCNLKADHQATQPCREGTSTDERLDPVIAELQRMSRLLTGLLEDTRHAPETAVPIDLAPCLNETITLARYQTPETITLEARAPSGLKCMLPRDSLRQVMINLLLNAVQAIGEGPGRVLVRIEPIDDTIVVNIEDDGPGFPEEMLATGPRLLTSHRKAGTGLGLATARRITEAMGGRLEIANRTVGGALVTLTLPCKVHDASPDAGHPQRNTVR